MIEISIMRIFRQAITKQIKEQVEKHEDDLPFNNLFGDGELRLVIPIESKNIQFIVNSLKNGETNTNTKYRVDLNKKIAYRLIQKPNGDIILDPRPMRLGKVIQKELGNKWADAWSIESSSEDSEAKSIVLSRSPVDVVRMSDHDAWTSCHSPQGSYFTSALEEAKDGGAIAYVVDNKDLDDFIKKNGNDISALQSEEIFKDDDREVEGLSPLSRIRVNRYVSDDGDELALPITRTYGEETSGFLDTVTDWLKQKQSKTVDYDRLNMSRYKRAGGQYADDADRKIMTNFFGNDKDVKKDLPHIGGQSRMEIWDAELYQMKEVINQQLKHSSVTYWIDEEQNTVFISGDGYIDFAFRGYVDDTKDDFIADLFNDFKSELQVNYCGYIDNVDITNENGIARLSLRIIMDQNDSINDPDDWQSRAESFVYYEETFYHQDIERLKTILIDKSILESVDEVEDKEEYLANNINDGNGIHGGGNDIDLFFNTGIKLPKMTAGVNQPLKDLVSNVFLESLQRNVNAKYSNVSGQMNFDFYANQERQYKDPKLHMDMSIVKPNYYISFANYDYLANFRIKIPYSEIYRLGKTYFDLLLKSYDAIYQDIYRATKQYMDNYNLTVNNETTAGKLNWYDLCKLSHSINKREIE
jgi:hypothetical protein